MINALTGAYTIIRYSRVYSVSGELESTSITYNVHEIRLDSRCVFSDVLFNICRIILFIYIFLQTWGLGVIERTTGLDGLGLKLNI